MSNIRYSEIFLSPQGEGYYTGRLTAWIRLFGCNLQCEGFGQKDPTDPSTYILPYKDFDITKANVKTIKDLPVWDYGCDSSYSWSKKYRDLCPNEHFSKVCDRIVGLLTTQYNPYGLFVNDRNTIHLAFTGGEPLLRKNQESIILILNEFYRRDNFPPMVTIETNGTQDLTIELIDTIQKYFQSSEDYHSYYYEEHEEKPGIEWFWSVSPKLWTVSGEKPEKAIKPEVVHHYKLINNRGQLKFVVRNDPRTWDELEEVVQYFKEHTIDWDVYIMPVGATVESQVSPEIREIAEETIRRGYYIAPRVQAYLFGNEIGT